MFIVIIVKCSNILFGQGIFGLEVFCLVDDNCFLLFGCSFYYYNNVIDIFSYMIFFSINIFDLLIIEFQFICVWIEYLYDCIWIFFFLLN